MGEANSGEKQNALSLDLKWRAGGKYLKQVDRKKNIKKDAADAVEIKLV